MVLLKFFGQRREGKLVPARAFRALLDCADEAACARLLTDPSRFPAAHLATLRVLCKFLHWVATVGTAAGSAAGSFDKAVSDVSRRVGLTLVCATPNRAQRCEEARLEPVAEEDKEESEVGGVQEAVRPAETGERRRGGGDVGKASGEVGGNTGAAAVHARGRGMEDIGHAMMVVELLIRTLRRG